jgi:hypothetical protein
MNMKRFWCKLALLALAAMPAFSQRVYPKIDSRVGFGDSVITHLADGGGWKTTITILNLSNTKAAAFTLNFYGDNGKPQSFSFVGIGNRPMLTGALSPGGEVIIKTAGAASPSSGWALFDSSSSDGISGFAVFSNDNGNEAAVPFESWLTDKQILSFDNTGGFGMGVSIVNTDSYSNSTVTATFRDESGTFLGRGVFTMGPLTHSAFIFKDRWPFTANRRGTVYFETALLTDIAVLGLRFTPAGAFTSVNALRVSTLD